MSGPRQGSKALDLSLPAIALADRNAYDTAMNIFAIFEDRIRGILEQLRAEGVLPGDAKSGPLFVVEPPRESAHGDIATNAAMMLAKPARMNPKELAARIAEKLSEAGDVAKAEVAGPGFINLTLKPEFWPAVLRAVLEQGKDYGRSNVGAGEAVNVEYVSANPTGPIHVGHTRGAVFGDALANLLDFAGFRPRANITSTTAAARWMCSRARHSCATARHWAKTSARFPRALSR